MQSTFRIGQKVRVVKDTEMNDGAIKRDTIKDGFAVGLTNSFVQVYKPKRKGDDDADPPYQEKFYEWFAINGRVIKVLPA